MATIKHCHENNNNNSEQTPDTTAAAGGSNSIIVGNDPRYSPNRCRTRCTL
ncbi:MAG: hypothetical protein LBC68_04180 [Prevotellaceae bacterium]|nr:hypothetical protein [Prevotellaceae bacterium]